MPPLIRPATHDECYPLLVFDGTYDEIDRVIGDRLDIACNWTKIAVEQYGEDKRAILIEHSQNAIATIVGDGIHFGRTQTITQTDVDDIVQRYGLHFA